MHILRYKILFWRHCIAKDSRTGSKRRQGKRKETGNSAEIVEVKTNHKRSEFNSLNGLLQDLQCSAGNSVEDTLGSKDLESLEF